MSEEGNGTPLEGLPGGGPIERPTLVACFYVQFTLQGQQLTARPLAFIPGELRGFVADHLEQVVANLRKQAPRIVVPRVVP